MLLKVSLAMYHQIKWILTEKINCCKKPLFPGRKEAVKMQWKKLNK
jgi:hypothetical protein